MERPRKFRELVRLGCVAIEKERDEADQIAVFGRSVPNLARWFNALVRTFTKAPKR